VTRRREGAHAVKIAVVGPEAGRETLCVLLADYSESICADPECIEFDSLGDVPADAWDLALIYTDDRHYETYLDFCRAHEGCEIVLWAEDARWAREGMHSHPAAFLLTPISAEQFCRAMRACRSWAGASRVFAQNTGKRSRRLRSVEVLYAESTGHACTVHGGGEEFPVNRSLSAVAKELGSGFLRCHRSYLVNLRAVAAVDGQFIRLTDGTVLPLSPLRAEELGEEIMAYQRRMGAFRREGAVK